MLKRITVFICAFIFIIAIVINGFGVVLVNGAQKKSIQKVNSRSQILHFRQRPFLSDNYRKIEKISSEYAVLVDADTNEVIAGKGASRRVFPASLTKVMTLITALDFAEDTEAAFSITGKEISKLEEAEASVAGFAAGEKVKFNELCYGLILPSGADAALGL